MPDFDGVHDLDDVGSLLEHNSIDCGQPMLMPFQLTSATHTKPQNTDAFTPRLSPPPPLSHLTQLRSIKKPIAVYQTLFTSLLTKYNLMVLLTFGLF